jgi:hypothetical protein
MGFSEQPMVRRSRGGLPAYCHPSVFAPTTHTVFHNNGDGTFTDETAKTGFSKAPGNGLGIARTAGPTFWLRTTPCRSSCSGTTTTARSPKWRSIEDSPMTMTPALFPEWASVSRIMITTLAGHLHRFPGRSEVRGLQESQGPVRVRQRTNRYRRHHEETLRLGRRFHGLR